MKQTAQKNSETTASASVRSINRCFDILDFLAADTQPRTLTEISTHLGAPMSTTLMIVRTLLERGLLAMDGKSKAYRIGLGFSRYAAQAQDIELEKIATPYLQKLAQATGETATLALFEGRLLYYTSRVVSNQPLQYLVPVGVPRPLHATAAGKVALAWMSDADLQKYIEGGLERRTANTIVEPEKLMRQIARIKKQGYAKTRAEGADGFFGIGAPITDGRGKLIAAINLGGPLFRIHKKQDACIQAVIDAAAAISSELKRIDAPVKLPSRDIPPSEAQA